MVYDKKYVILFKLTVFSMAKDVK